MSDSSASARRKRFKDRISENRRNSDDSTSLKHPFLGMAGSHDTVKFANESSEHFSVVHTPATTRSLFFWLIVFGVYPLSILINSALQWVPSEKIDNDLNWYGLLCIGLSGVSLFGYLLLTPRWIECDFHEQTLTYRVGGLRGFVFGIRFRDIKNVTVGEYVVVSRGGLVTTFRRLKKRSYQFWVRNILSRFRCRMEKPRIRLLQATKLSRMSLLVV